MRSTDAQRLKYAIAWLLAIDQSATEAIPEPVRESLTCYRAFILTDEIVQAPRHRSKIAYAGVAALAAIALFVLVTPIHRGAQTQSAIVGLMGPAPIVPPMHRAHNMQLPLADDRIAVARPTPASPKRDHTTSEKSLTVRIVQAKKHLTAVPAARVAQVPPRVRSAAAAPVIVAAAPTAEEPTAAATPAVQSAIDTATAYVTENNPGVTVQSANVIEKTNDGAVVEVNSNDEGANITDRIVLSANPSGYTVRAQHRASGASSATSLACYDGREWKECSGGD
ncbi:MAG: hypothetical protein JO165_02715 [Candidatus Eremiobacteraeota bacterium]|nr:hypothetical protein [Candidatus Eremiobacteraeota bacterium]